MHYTESRYRWYILALTTATAIIVVAMPGMAMSVLSTEIAAELHLSLVQVGVIWGIAALPGIVSGVFGGALGDQLGPKWVLTFGCLVLGLVGAARIWVMDYPSLLTLALLIGAVTPFVMMNLLKQCGQWFPLRQLGLANGIISMGMAFGFLSGSLLSATVFSPWLGGWRRVFLLYGISGALFSIPWVLARSPFLPGAAAGRSRAINAMREGLVYVVRQRDIWLLGLVIFGVGGCVQGVLGYLPLYLRNLGWNSVRADGALSTFHLVSMLAVLPIALSSDRFGSRKRLLFGAGLLLVLGVGLLAVLRGGAIWVAVIMAGLMRDAFMSLFITLIFETEGIGAAYAGTATGVVLAFSGLGSFLAPPIGNNLAGTAPQLPFLFWAALALSGLGCLMLTGKKAPRSGLVS
ncbi:MAG: MFS transporter [Anaerolineae bacterium]|jgi:MFS family permease|nr:MFS transporter [Anaerolineae bacterium]